jgi:hypothetical protein
VPQDAAELSALASALTEVQRRVSALAERAAASRDEELATELFAIERALTGASRRLDRLTSTRRRG